MSSSTRPLGIWPAPPPPGPRRTPWQPDPGPPAAPTMPSQWAIIDTGPDWVAERLLERRMVTLSGRLDSAAANRAVASLALLDASGDDPIELRLCDVDADLDVAFTVLVAKERHE